MNFTRRMMLSVAAAAMLGLSAQAQAEGLKFGVAAEPYPPFSSKDTAGKWVGWEIDLMNALCEQMKEKCELVEVAWDGIIPALTSKQIDVIFSSMSITAERKQTIDFSNMYYNTRHRLSSAPRPATWISLRSTSRARSSGCKFPQFTRSICKSTSAQAPN